MRKNRAYCNKRSRCHDQLPNDQRRSPTDHELFDAYIISLLLLPRKLRCARRKGTLCACAIPEIARSVRHPKTITSLMYIAYQQWDRSSATGQSYTSPARAIVALPAYLLCEEEARCRNLGSLLWLSWYVQ